jgi:cleavage and polyadenylation specificity factor subunit 3
MFGEKSIPVTSMDDDIRVVVDQKVAVVNVANQTVSCPEDPMFEQIVQTAVSKLYNSLVVSHPI